MTQIAILIILTVGIIAIVLLVKSSRKKSMEKEVNKQIDEVYSEEFEFLEWVVTIWDWADIHEVYNDVIPRSETLLIGLKELDLSNNNLTNLPKEIAKITGIQSLNLSNNQLSEIPDEIYTMPNLTHLYLGGNQFKNIPQSFVNLSNFIVFDTSDNPLHELDSKNKEINNDLSISINNVIKSIDSLAPLSQAVVEVQKLFLETQEELDINSFIKMIETDALLSFNILKMANSPVYGFSAKISSISKAVTLFGAMQIYGFVMKYASSTNIIAKTEIYGSSNERFNDICNMQSAILMQWYSKVNLEEAKLLAPLALVMETGKLVIAAEVTATSSGKEFKKGYRKSKDIALYEKKILGVTSYGINSMVFEHWHLDSVYISILKGLNGDDNLAKDIEKYVKILNVIISAVNLKSMLSKESISKACMLVEEMGLNADTFKKVALKVKATYITELKTRETRSN